MISDIIISVMEWVGTVSFTVSGALVAISCGLDLFGVIIVGGITAVGGGILRDVLLGNVPPKIFENPWILGISVITAIFVFWVAYIKRKGFSTLREKTEMVNNFFDALGLASFSITGIEMACLSPHRDNILLVITLGVITGVGGGILRDVLVNEKPYVLVKHVYAVASLAGCCLYYAFNEHKIFATFLTVIFIVAVRMLAAKFHWKLPKIKIDE